MQTIERLKKELHEPDASLFVQIRDVFTEWEMINDAYELSDKGRRIFNNYLSSAIYNVGMASLVAEDERESYRRKLTSLYQDVDIMKKSTLNHLKSKPDGTGYNLYQKKLNKWISGSALVTNQAFVEKSLKETLGEVMGIFKEDLTDEMWQKCLSVYRQAQETGTLNKKALEKALWIVLAQNANKVLEFKYKNVKVDDEMIEAFKEAL